MTTYIPTCPECGRECFAPSIQPTDSASEPRIIWWCRDMGHWAGDSNGVVWKTIMPVIAETRRDALKWAAEKVRRMAQLDCPPAGWRELANEIENGLEGNDTERTGDTQ